MTLFKLSLWLFLAVCGLTLCVVSTAYPAEVTYADAYTAYQAGAPMVVIAHADYCGPCRALIASLRGTEIMFCTVDVQNPPSAEVLAACRNGEPIPIVNVWRQKRQPLRRIGNIGVAGVRALLRE